MNKLNFVVIASALLTLAGCAHTHKQAENPPPTPKQVAVTQLEGDRSEFISRTQARIDEMSKYATQLRERSVTAQKPEKKKLENAADDLDSSLRDAKKDLTEVRDAAPENWLDYKRDVTKTMQSAETQYSNSVHLIQ
jgi:hypothetical protein